MNPQSAKKIGLFGLSANPPHYGHVKMAQYAKAVLGLDEVWWIIALQNPLKSESGMASFADRLAMCRLIAEDYDWLKVSDIEQRTGLTKSFDVISKIMADHPQNRFVWIMGGDNLARFHKWYRWQDLMKTLPIAVMARPDQAANILNAPAAHHPDFHHLDNPAQLADAPRGIVLLDNPLVPISSSGLRDAFKKEDQRIIAGTKPQVAEMIRQKRLYFQ